MKKKLAVGAALIALILVVVLIYWSSTKKKSDLPDGIVSSNGRIEAEQVDIMAKSGGRVDKLLVQEGDMVFAGQILAQIDTTELQAERARYRANQASARASAEEANATVDQRLAELVLKRANRSRALAIAASGSISQQTRDEAVSEDAVARATLLAAKKSAASSIRSVDASKAQVRQIDAQIADATLTAPSKGRVLYRLARPGEVVSAGGKVLTIVDLSNVYMELYLGATQASRVPLGSQARILVDGSEIAIPAKVSFVSPEAQFTPKQVETQSEREKLVFRVKLRLPQAYIARHIAQLKTGSRGTGYVRLDANPAAWPTNLQKRQNGDPVDAQD